MDIIKEPISKDILDKSAKETFGDFVKAVVDIERGIMAIGGELHADEEALMLENGSIQKNLWGINIYPDRPEDQRVEFNSIINIRPSQKNNSRGVEDVEVQKKIMKVVGSLIQ